MLKKEVEEPVLVGHVLDLSRIGSILSLSSSSNWLDRLVRSVQNPAQGQELLLRHVPLLQRCHEDVHFVGPLQLVSYPSIQVTRLSSPPPWNQVFPSPDPPPSCSRSGRESLWAPMAILGLFSSLVLCLWIIIFWSQNYQICRTDLSNWLLIFQLCNFNPK